METYMRKLLSILIALAAVVVGTLASPAFAQVGQIPSWPPIQPASAAVSCTPGTAATNFLARTSGLSALETTATCTLINDLVTAGAITGNLTSTRGCGTVLENFYFLATKDKTTAYLNICGTSFGLTETATVTCTVDVGCAGDGVSGFLDTGWIPSVNCANCTQDNAAMGVYIQSTTAVSGKVPIGVGCCGGLFMYMVTVQSGSFQWEANGSTFPNFANTNPQGAWGWSRNGTPTTSSVYLNSATTKANNVSDPSIGLVTGSLYLLALDNAGVPANFSNYVISCAWVSAGMTSTMVFAVNNACNHAMTILGHAVY
jgi:hypothetical protein